MNRPLLYLLLCMLLLPLVGSGQGIEINKNELAQIGNPNEFQKSHIESGRFKLVNYTFYKERKVKSVAIYGVDKKIKYSLVFNDKGNIITKVCPSLSIGHSIRTDSIFFHNKTVISKRFYKDDGDVVETDTLIFETNEDFIEQRRVQYHYIKGDFLKSIVSIAEYYNRENSFKLGYYRIKQRLKRGYIKLNSRKDTVVNDSLYLIYSHKSSRIGFLQPESNSDKKQIRYTQNNVWRVYPMLLNYNETKEENDNPVNYNFPHCGTSSRTEGIDLNLRTVKEMRFNKRGLIDTIYRSIYQRQLNTEPCVRPKDSLNNMFLNGFSGIPKSKYVEYTFRYEYFEE